MRREPRDLGGCVMSREDVRSVRKESVSIEWSLRNEWMKSDRWPFNTIWPTQLQFRCYRHGFVMDSVLPNWSELLGSLRPVLLANGIMPCRCVTSRLDYANSVLYSAPSRCLTCLQRIQNSVARIVLQQPSLSSLDTLHWLPVKWRISLSWLPLPIKS